MVIEIVKSENEAWKPKLSFSKLAVGDYLTFSVDKVQKEIAGGEYGKSYFCFAEVFDYSYFDVVKRTVIDKKFPEPEKVTVFLNEKTMEKVNKIGLQKLVRLQAVETKSGKVTYDVKEYKGENSPSSEFVITDVELINEGSLNEKEDILELIKHFRKCNFTDEMIIKNLTPKYPEGSVKELLKINK